MKTLWNDRHDILFGLVHCSGLHFALAHVCLSKPSSFNYWYDARNPDAFLSKFKFEVQNGYHAGTKHMEMLYFD